MVDQSRLHIYTKRMLPLLLLLWLAALIPAVRALLKYESTAGTMQPAPSHWPGSPMSVGNTYDADRSSNQGLLIVAVHPLCSCTRATLEELENSAAGWKQPYRAEILVYTPNGHADDPSHSTFALASYIRDAKQALHADLVLDEGGGQAARLGALTSGAVLYYSASDKRGQRRLLFSGGVTGGRGMVGENGGIEALEQAVQTTSLEAENRQEAHSPVYGCGLSALSNPDSRSSSATSTGSPTGRPTGTSTRSQAR